MQKGGKVKKSKSDESLKVNFSLDYLYNQLKVGIENLDASVTSDEKRINSFRVESIQKLIDKNLKKLTTLK